MNSQFHTPSLGDEVFDLTEMDNQGGAATSSNYQHQMQHSKRMRVGMDESMDEYHSATDESFTTNTSHNHNHNNNNNNNNNNTSSLVHGHSSTPTTAAMATTTTLGARKQLTPTDPDEPAKPLSAYALFFRDTVSAIKQQNPNCSFQELSRIVASMWEALDPTHKNVYNKKNEMARNEYIKQMRHYRQQQIQNEQQQPAQMTNNNNNNNTDLGNNAVLQSKPAVFTITRQNSDGSGSNNNNIVNQYTSPILSSPQQQQQQQPVQNTSAATAIAAQQPQFDISAQSPQQQTQMFMTSTPVAAVVNSNAGATPNDPAAPQIQMLTEAGSVQKCTRENCNKRAIINPDWEDEYCSNECVVIHCRNVFNSWVQSNLEARKQ